MKSYTLFKKSSGGKTFFYVQFTDRATNKRLTARSVEKIREELGDRETYHITRRAEADSICRRALDAGFADGGRDTKTAIKDFISFLREFWDYSSSEYIARKNEKARLEGKPKALHRDYCDNRFRDVNKHVRDRLPKGLKCKDVSFHVIEKLQSSVIAETNVSTWLGVKKTISAPIKELLRKRIIFQDPFAGLENYSSSSKSNVGTYTDAEISRLLSQMYHDCTVGRPCIVRKPYPGSRKIKDNTKPSHFILDRRIWLITNVLIQTGLRLGEALALSYDSIRFVNTDDSEESQAILIIDKAYSKAGEFKEPKGKENRAVAIPLWLAHELVAQSEKNPWDNGLVFYSSENGIAPITESWVRDNIYLELTEIGINADIRKERNLTVHSIRHYCTQKTVTRAGSENALLTIGHKSMSVQQRYDNAIDIERVLGIGKQTGNLILNPTELSNVI